MRKLLFLGLLFALFCTISISNYGQEAIIAAGGDGNGSGGSVSYSIGQIACSGSEDASLAEGVQQVYLISVLFIDKNRSDLSIDLQLFPNPTPDGIYVSIGEPDLLPLKYSLYQINGSIQDQGIINSTLSRIEMDELSPSVYILKVYHDSSLIKSFQIIKN